MDSMCLCLSDVPVGLLAAVASMYSGSAELAAGEVTIRDLRSDDFEQTQRRVARGDVAFAVAELLTKS